MPGATGTHLPILPIILHAEEFYAVAFRKKLYRNLEGLRTDLDLWMQVYNQERTHSGKYCFGRTPYQTFQESKQLAKNKMLDILFHQEAETQISGNFQSTQVVR